MAQVIEPIKARRKILLTGTPIVNRPSELYPLISYLDPERWGNYVSYAKRYCNAHQTRYGWEFGGANEQRLPELQETLRATIMIRRLKADVMAEMPAKMRQTVVIPATSQMKKLAQEEQRWASEAGLDEIDEESVDLTGLPKVPAFEEMSRVRHELAMAKIPFTIEYIEGMIEAGTNKIVVMAHHHAVQDAICEALAQKKVSHVLHRGGLSDHVKQEAVDRFQNNEACKVFVGSIRASGVGITLTAAHDVVFAELDWVPGNLSQAEDRCHRIGQTQTVWVHHLVVEGSLDEEMSKRVIAKQKIADVALDNKREIVEPKKVERKAVEAKPGKTTFIVGRATLQLTNEQLDAARQAIKILAGNDPDRAAERNGVGFNGLDTSIGHDLAARDRLSDKQAALAWKIVYKYQGQLGAALTAQLKGEAVNGTDDGATADDHTDSSDRSADHHAATTNKVIKLGWTDQERQELREACLKYGPFQGCKEFAATHTNRSEQGAMYQWSKMKQAAR
jgi:hypothetical protein